MLLEKIQNPQDIRKLNFEELALLAQEIRQRIIQVISQSGGHLASSLGAVDLTLALHYCLDTPKDKIVWDVGHQTYAHKILTSRNKDFDCVRKYQGLSGFPSKDESVYDSFTTGHSSTAVSLAFGLACSRDYLKENYKVVAVIGDGSLSGGLCFEGLNNAGHSKKDLVVVLNTNEMSIAPNAGAVSVYLNKLISLPIYNRFKGSLETFLKSRVPKGSRILKIANKFEEGLKGLFIPGMLFEELGFRYFGPFDGHNLAVLIPAFKNILAFKGPILVHVITKKGKGYAPAENDPVKFHSASSFEIATGKSLKEEAATYTGIIRGKLVRMAKDDPKIMAITAAMPEGTGLDKFRDAYAERFFDVGIAEEHAVCFAAGLAKNGLKPVVAVYSTFLQRAYDQIIECVALQNLAVTFLLDRSGVVSDDGPTHQGVFDIAYLRNIPNLVLLAPKDGQELEAMLEFAVNLGQPTAIRYPKERIPTPNSQLPTKKIELGKAEILKEGGDILIIAYGSMVLPALAAGEILAGQGILAATVVNARFAKPLDTILLRRLESKAKFIFTVEDGVVDGGFGSAVSEALKKPVIRLGLPDEFIPCGKREILLEKFGLTGKAIAANIKSIIHG